LYKAISSGDLLNYSKLIMHVVFSVDYGGYGLGGGYGGYGGHGGGFVGGKVLNFNLDFGF
jgi:hypothetical protein